VKKRADLTLEQAKRAHQMMLGAGLMFVLAGAIPLAVDLILGGELSSLNASFVAIGGAFIAIAYANSAKAKKAAESRDAEPRP